MVKFAGIKIIDMKGKDICYFLIAWLCSRHKINIWNERISTRFYFHEFIVLAKIAKIVHWWK